MLAVLGEPRVYGIIACKFVFGQTGASLISVSAVAGFY